MFISQNNSFTCQNQPFFWFQENVRFYHFSDIVYSFLIIYLYNEVGEATIVWLWRTYLEYWLVLLMKYRHPGSEVLATSGQARKVKLWRLDQEKRWSLYVCFYKQRKQYQPVTASPYGLLSSVIRVMLLLLHLLTPPSRSSWRDKMGLRRWPTWKVMRMRYIWWNSGEKCGLESRRLEVCLM